MGYYNVVQPCVVEKKHHVRPTVQPIEVDDEVAAPLVESGELEPYQPSHWSEKIAPGAFANLLTGRLLSSGTAGIRAGDYSDAHEAVCEAVEKGEVDPGTFTLADPENDPPVQGPSRKRGRRKSGD